MMNAPNAPTLTNDADRPRRRYGIPSIADYMNCKPRKLYRMLDKRAGKDARLPLWKWGGMWCADEPDIDAWIELQKLKRGVPTE